MYIWLMERIERRPGPIISLKRWSEVLGLKGRGSRRLIDGASICMDGCMAVKGGERHTIQVRDELSGYHIYHVNCHKSLYSIFFIFIFLATQHSSWMHPFPSLFIYFCLPNHLGSGPIR